MTGKTRLGQCACVSDDAHHCWALRYHGHTGVSELTIHNEGGPCECDCHVDDPYEEDEWQALTPADRGGEA